MQQIYISRSFVTLLLLPAILFLFSCEPQDPIAIQHQVQDTIYGPLIHAHESTPIPDQYIVTFNDNALKIPFSRSGNQVEMIAETVSREAKKILTDNRIPAEAMQQIFDGKNKGMVVQASQGDLVRLMRDSRVQLVEQDQRFSIGTSMTASTKTPVIPSSEVKVDYQIIPLGVLAVGGSVNMAKSKKRAWVLDSGIDLDHSDLNVNTRLSKNFCSGYTSKTSADDDFGHGTHVAGIIGAKDNGDGVVGVAAGVELVSIKVLNEFGEGTVSDMIAALDYVAKRASTEDVINISISGPMSPGLDKAVQDCQAQSGATIVIAAGNHANDVQYYSPARVPNTDKIYTISSINYLHVFSDFANYGLNGGYVAPGEHIYSTFRNNSYGALSGTSMAAPHAAGVFLITQSPKVKGYSTGESNDKISPIISHQ